MCNPCQIYTHKMDTCHASLYPMVFAQGCHSINLWHSTCICGILSNTLNLTIYWKIPLKSLYLTPSNTNPLHFPNLKNPYFH